MHFHSPGMDKSKFQKDWDIPGTCLPCDIGGQLETTFELHSKHCETLTQLRDYFIADEDEAKII